VTVSVAPLSPHNRPRRNKIESLTLDPTNQLDSYGFRAVNRSYAELNLMLVVVLLTATLASAIPILSYAAVLVRDGTISGLL
jgi:hypothetical protein